LVNKCDITMMQGGNLKFMGEMLKKKIENRKLGE
jgi:hypothetical protein